MTTRKYVSLERLTEYDELIKAEIDSGDASVKSYVDTELDSKSDINHQHSWNELNDRPFGEISECLLNWSGVVNKGTTISMRGTVPASSEVLSALRKKGVYTIGFNGSKADANVEQIYMNQVLGFRNVKFDNGYKIEYQVDMSSPNSASLVVYNDNWSNNSDLPETLNVTFTIGESTIKQIPIEYIPDELMDEAKSYADSAAATVKNDLLNGAGAACDTLKELGDLINENTTALDALEDIATGKADANHEHDASEITVQSPLEHMGNDGSLDAVLETFDSTLTTIEGALIGKANTTHSHNGSEITYDGLNGNVVAKGSSLNSVIVTLDNEIAEKAAVQIITWEADD